MDVLTSARDLIRAELSKNRKTPSLASLSPHPTQIPLSSLPDNAFYHSTSEALNPCLVPLTRLNPALTSSSPAQFNAPYAPPTSPYQRSESNGHDLVDAPFFRGGGSL